MDKRERMARDKRAKAKAGRVARVLKRRKALDTARALELERRKADVRQRLEARQQVLEAAAEGSAGQTAVE